MRTLLLGLRAVFFSVLLMLSSLLRPGVSRGGTGGGPLTRLPRASTLIVITIFWLVGDGGCPSASLGRRDHREDVPVPEDVVYWQMERRPRVDTIQEPLEQVGMYCLGQVLNRRTRRKEVDVGKHV